MSSPKQTEKQLACVNVSQKRPRLVHSSSSSPNRPWMLHWMGDCWIVRVWACVSLWSRRHSGEIMAYWCPHLHLWLRWTLKAAFKTTICFKCFTSVSFMNYQKFQHFETPNPLSSVVGFVWSCGSDQKMNCNMYLWITKLLRSEVLQSEDHKPQKNNCSTSCGSPRYMSVCGFNKSRSQDETLFTQRGSQEGDGLGALVSFVHAAKSNHSETICPGPN